MNNDYKKWIIEVKQKIRSTQIKAAIAVNSTLIEFYWYLGKMITEKENVWGGKLIEQVSKDLKEEFPDMQGLSRRNLFNTQKFYQFYSNSIVQQPVALIGQQLVDQLQTIENKQDTTYPRTEDKIVQQLVAQIPWGHNILIFTKSKDIKEALFYIQKTKDNNWSRDTLALQIKSNLYKRQGKAITNFTNTLPAPNSDLALQTLKDPYIFDFLQLAEDYKERDIENQLIQHIIRFLLEMGKGFAFVGKQYNIQLNEKEYFIDLLFYHIPLQCYVVVELKNKDFEPEFAGKLNFYLTLIDKTLKRENENPTIGILLCRGKDNMEVEYALQDIHKPMGVSEFKLDEALPENFKSSLPSIEELEEELKKIEK
ncbi:MAG: PDDEXK nuclease domain-containing protein [Chitinispirillales bacterium]|jgi:predicted nuclease of restriction endonuclease-like (RecB) superfamily|nr:PDDEXK nuclease domain-containing protein [Chitinispirillales bacterium]